MYLELTILGSGTSQGVPVIGRDYPPEFLANPKNHRTRPSVLVGTDDFRFVIDTTPEFRIQCLRENVRHLDAILISHSHADHIMGLDDCRRFCDLRKGEPLPVYGSQQTLQDLRRVFDYAFDGRPIPRGYFHPDAREISGPFTLGPLRVEPFDLPHGRFVTTGLVFSWNQRRLLAYFSDCKEVPDPAVDAAFGADIVILDALRKRSHPTHMSLDEALAAARRLNGNQTLLTHLTDEYDHDVDNAELPPGVQLAYDGLKVRLDLQ